MIGWWRLRHLGRNPLVRAWDRVESALLLVAILIVLLAVPVAAVLGSETYSKQREAIATESATRHQATAVLLAEAPGDIVSPRGIPVRGRAAVEATWRLPDGSSVTGVVSAERGTTAGSTVGIWLDENGVPVSVPRSVDAAVWNAVTVAVLAWLAAVAVCAGAFWLIRLALDRRRYARWERDWTRVDTDWSHS